MMRGRKMRQMNRMNIWKTMSGEPFAPSVKFGYFVPAMIPMPEKVNMIQSVSTRKTRF